MPLDAPHPGFCAPLWKRLMDSQRPMRAASSPTTGSTTSAHVPLSFSCVVVPPPVPAAQPRFDAHIASLVQRVQPLTFMTVTSRTPYLPTTGTPEVTSPTQRAIAEIVRAVKTDSVSEDATAVVLTIAGTMPATVEETALSCDGLRDMLNDYLGRAAKATAVEAKTALAQGSPAEMPWVSLPQAGLLTMRGVDGGYTRRQWLSAHPSATITASTASTPTSPAPKTPYGAFQDGQSLLLTALDIADAYRTHQTSTSSPPTPPMTEEDPLTMLVPGFPEGHMLHRFWSCTEAEYAQLTRTASSQTAASDALTERGYRFLQMLEDTLKTTAVLHHGGQETAIPGADVAETIRKLIRRTDAAMLLGTVPAYLPAATLESEVRELVRDKLIPIARGSHRGATTPAHPRRVPVVVTQTIFDAQAFITYATMVRRHFRDEWVRLTSTSTANSPTDSDAADSMVDVVVLPGVLSPQRGEDFTRTVLQLCVRTAVPAVQELLQTYKTDLSQALAAWENAMSAEEVERNTADASDAIRLHKEQAESRFQANMEALTLDMCRQLILGGYGHLYFSAFAYGCGEALGHVVEQLLAEENSVLPIAGIKHRL